MFLEASKGCHLNIDPWAPTYPSNPLRWWEVSVLSSCDLCGSSGPARENWALWSGVDTKVCRLQPPYPAHIKGSTEERFILKFGSTEK